MNKLSINGGPLDGRQAPEALGERWPAILYWQPGSDALLGYYERRGDSYHYTGETEAVPIDRLARGGLGE
ncbi:MAG: hypothetical protein ACRD2Z_09720 [Thermoanaerobaculia bacterium]